LAITGLDEWYLIRGVLHEQARAHLAAGRSVVVDNLNEEVVDRAAFRAIADEQGAETIVVHVDAPLDVIAERRRRNDREPARGTTSDEEFAFVLSRFEPPTPSERWIRYSAGDDVGDWLDELQRFRATREA
jgi:predicted kinase